MSNIIKVAMIGDLIGVPGQEQLFLKLQGFKRDNNIDFVIANGENSDDGFGITEDIIDKMHSYGVDVITSGNHIWSNHDAGILLEQNSTLLRPHNYPDAPGRGWWIGNVLGVDIAVVNLIGRYMMTPVDCPFQTLTRLLKRELDGIKVIIVDFHGELMAEKKSFASDFDGRISLLAGTHTHVQTADELIFHNGTGYITDLGMTGGINSIIGMERKEILRKLKRQINAPYVPARENEKMQGIIGEIDLDSGKTVSITRFNV